MKKLRIYLDTSVFDCRVHRRESVARLQALADLLTERGGDAMTAERKPFDCVRMKAEIQRRLMAEQAGMTLAERQRDMEAKALADPILGPWFRQVQAAAGQAVAEDKASYRTPTNEP